MYALPCDTVIVGVYWLNDNDLRDPDFADDIGLLTATCTAMSDGTFRLEHGRTKEVDPAVTRCTNRTCSISSNTVEY